MTADTPMDTHALSLDCARVLFNRKGEDIKVLDVKNSLAISDYFVIVTGKNRRHLRAMAEELRQYSKERGLTIPREEVGSDDSRWVLLDMGDIIVHLFDTETRAFYDLDALWADAPQVKWSA